MIGASVKVARILLLFCCAACGSGEPSNQSSLKIPRESSLRAAKTPQEIVRMAIPSVVVLTTKDEQGNPLALGTGFFVADGVVATNAHVIRGASSATSKALSDDRVSTVVGIAALDETHDVALLTISTTVRQPVLQISSDPVEIGSAVFTVGNPEGLEGTFSAGMVSGKRFVSGDTLLQVTAPISPGSSGGPVINQIGNVIGIATAAFKEGQNLNFAVPSSRIAALLNARHGVVSLSSHAVWSKASQAPTIGQGAAAIVGEHFDWSGAFDIDGKFTLGLRNRSADPITAIQCLIVFYDANGRPVEAAEVRSYGAIAPGLAKRVSGEVDPSVKRLTTRKTYNGVSYERQPSTRVEVRILDYQLVK